MPYIYDTFTLGQGGGTGPGIMQVLVYALFIVIFISTMIKNIIKENRKKARRKQGAVGEAQDGGGVSLDEITARRRAQLQAMESQRDGSRPGQAGRPPQAFTGDDTANLSMADRIARARAANQNKAQARSANPLPSQAPPAAAGANAREQRRAALQQRMVQREQQRREAVAARQRQVQQAKAQRAAQSARPQPQPKRPAPPAPPAPRTRRPLPPVQTPHPVSVDPHDEVHRMVADAPTSSAAKSSRRHASASVEAERAAKAARSGTGATSKALLDFDKLSAADLRRAFILKEVLDRPVAERDPLAG